MPGTEDILLPFPTPIVTARHARSTVLIGSIGAVRGTERFDEYAALLTAEQREILLNLVAGTWVDIELALAHYQACDALGYSVDEQLANGRATFDKTSGTLLGTVLRMAKQAGVTPWSILPQFQRFWHRGYDGGGVRVTRIAPKEARVELVQFRLCESRYYKNALRGLVTAIVERFCRRAYLVEEPSARASSAATFRVQWA